MSKTITSKSVDRLVETINDLRFHPKLFAMFIIDESPYVNAVFYEIIQAYLKEMARDYECGTSNHNGIASQCARLLGGSSINLD
jgi:hypothetical protein